MVFIAHLLIRQNDVNVFDLIIFSVALTVSVIPEALPLVTTFSLSQGARRLAKKKILVKRLSAVEDLGGIEVLCSDKTGTLTKSKLAIGNIYSDNAQETLWLANLASSFEMKKKIEPFDIALERALNVQQKKRIQKIQKIADEPFDPRTRKNVVLVKEGNTLFLIERGAPEVILPRCTNIDRKQREQIDDWI